MIGFPLVCRPRILALLPLLLITARAATAQLEGSGHALSEADAKMPQLHHVGLNSADPEKAIAWYLRAFPTAKRTTVAGYPAVQTDMLLLFNKTATAPSGAFRQDLSRSGAQSAFWHIGATIPGATREKLQSLGFVVLPLYVSADKSKSVFRSGEAPYSGTKTAAEMRVPEAMAPRDGGFSYTIGPDGVLFEVTSNMQALPSFSHLHFLHEQPLCAVNWYVEHLGMAPGGPADSSGRPRPQKAPVKDCNAKYGDPSWPSVEPAGTIRQPLGQVRFGNGSMSWYPRQCVNGRCGEDQKLAPSRGQVLDHVAFSVKNFDDIYNGLRRYGVKMLESPHPFGDARAFMFEDPDGLAIEIVDAGGTARPRPAPPPR
jgi:catechol 2,3-dioxygenase-like lactoylglutathione lyase family enzyme